MRRFVALLLTLVFAADAFAGISIVRSNGISLSGADGITYTGISGLSLTGADGFLLASENGISLSGADGVPITGLGAVNTAGANALSYTGPNGISLAGADGISLSGADGILLTGADGISLTGADGVLYRADSVLLQFPTGISLSGADGISLSGADGLSLLGAVGILQLAPDTTSIEHVDGLTLASLNGISLSGADSILLAGAGSATGIGPTGVAFQLANPTGISLSGADNITLTNAFGINVADANNLLFVGVDPSLLGVVSADGLAGLDPQLALTLNTLTDDSSVNAIIVYHDLPTSADLSDLRRRGILGGTRMHVLPIVYVTATKSQLLSISRLPHVRSIYGNRTLNFDVDPYFETTGIGRVPLDPDLHTPSGQTITGRGVTVAVLDTGLNTLHPDLLGKAVQNVRLLDLQSIPLGFQYPLPLEGLPDTDLVAGHGTFVSGIIAGSGASSAGLFAGVAPGARLLGLSAGDVALTNILSGFDYILYKGDQYGVKVVNCSFSSDTVFDINDPVNIATKMLTDRGVNVVFSAGNKGPSNNSLNPYALAPWVISVGATDHLGSLASFSSRGDFGDSLKHPSLVAPGVDIVSVRSLASTMTVGGILTPDPHRLTPTQLLSYLTASGTSFSAPQVSGAIALMLEVNPQLTPAEIKDILMRTATPMPQYYFHEVGAGMLNTHAAVLNAAFAGRRMGAFRASAARNTVFFRTSPSQPFRLSVPLGAPAPTNIDIPPDTVQANVNIAWGISTNDFGLKVFSGDTLLGESNFLNLPLLTGRRESVTLAEPSAGAVRAEVAHTLGLGLPQTVGGTYEITQAIYPELTDLAGLTPSQIGDVKRSLLTGVMLPEASLFRPFSEASRLDLADGLLRAGAAPQYLANSPIFPDLADPTLRIAPESLFARPGGALIEDALPGYEFRPFAKADRLTAVIAYVRAAGLENEALTAFLPAIVTDRQAIPPRFRGYVAVALRTGLITLDGKRFNKNRAITRLELAASLNRLIDLKISSAASRGSKAAPPTSTAARRQ